MKKWFLENVPGNESEFWDNHWGRSNIIEQLQGVFDDPNMKIIQKTFSKSDSLIEAGCGLGRFLIPLHEIGYSIQGIDYSDKTINEIKTFNPKYKVDVGNILCLDFPNETFNGYISFGVVEHLPEGPHNALIEAYRVLKKGGFILVSVPYMNIVRRIKLLFPWLISKKNRFSPGSINKQKNFYAYVFNKNGYVKELEKANFEVCEVFPICISFGFLLEFPIFGKFKLTRAVTSLFIDKVISKVTPLAWIFAHMIMIVAKKK